MSNAKVLLPEPETPVTTLNLPRGTSTVIAFRLCSRVDDADRVAACVRGRAPGAHQRLQRQPFARDVLAQAQRLLVLAQRAAGVRRAVCLQVLRRAGGDQLAAGVTA